MRYLLIIALACAHNLWSGEFKHVDVTPDEPDKIEMVDFKPIPSSAVIDELQKGSCCSFFNCPSNDHDGYSVCSCGNKLSSKYSAQKYSCGNIVEGERAMAGCGACCNHIWGTGSEADCCAWFNWVSGDGALVSSCSYCNRPSGKNARLYCAWGNKVSGDDTRLFCTHCSSLSGNKSSAGGVCCNNIANNNASMCFPSGCNISRSNSDEILYCCFIDTGTRRVPCCCAASVGRALIWESIRDFFCCR